VPRSERGVGVWRDGAEIIIHPSAALPRFCVVSGEAARFGYYLSIAWSRPFDLTPRTLGLYIPLSAQVHYLCCRRRWQAIGTTLAAVALTALALIRHDLAGASGIAASFGLLIVLGLLSSYFYVQYTQFLYFSRLEGEYLRLRGADERFLRRLPEWNT
jgi:hypothetical protein